MTDSRQIEKRGVLMAELLRFRDFQKSEPSWLRSENRRLRAALDQNRLLLDDAIDEVVDLKFSLEEATGVAQS